MRDALHSNRCIMSPVRSACRVYRHRANVPFTEGAPPGAKGYTVDSRPSLDCAQCHFAHAVPVSPHPSGGAVSMKTVSVDVYDIPSLTSCHTGG